MTLRPQAPAYVQFYPTLRCTHSCSFCFNRGLAEVEDCALPEFQRIIGALDAAGVDTIDLLGGEPTLHPDLPAMLEALADRGMRTTISTNGAADPAQLERIADAGANRAVRIGISVNSGGFPPHLRDFVARRVPILKSVCTRAWRIAPEIGRHLARPGAEFYLLYRDAIVPEDLPACLSFPAYVERLRALRQEHPGVQGVSCGGFVPDLKSSPELGAVRCPAGTTKLSILPDGSVYPCYLLFRRPEFRLGTIQADPFERIWSHPSLRFFRTYRGNPCTRRECEHHPGCHGGCPAVSLLLTGDIAAPDPRCVG